MLIEKEVIGPGTIWYNDLKSGAPRKSLVTPAHIQHWCDRGNEMLALGLTVPVPCEHDFQAHPMTPAEKLINNAGWVNQYKVTDGRLFSVLDIQDEALAKKLPTTIKWTSPWFSSFTDGNGKKWDNVIAHMALTTRPRVTNQAPFPSIAAALSAAEDCSLPETDVALSMAGLLKADGEPEDSAAFTDAFLATEPAPKVDKEKQKADEQAAAEEGYYKKLLFQLLQKLGVPLPEVVTEDEFKEVLAQAADLKIQELTSKNKNKPQNPVLQEQQPMYMSLEDIQKIPDETMRGIALSMYNENVKLRAERDVDAKMVASLRDSKIAEETAKRKMRCDRLGRMSPRVKADLEAMLPLPSMALSMGDGGQVTDPMAQTLSILEKGLADLPAILSTETTLQVMPQPTDGEMSAEESDKLADTMARQMGCPPEKKAG